MQRRHELFEHGADVGVRGFGRTKAEAFAEAARAVTALVTDPAGVRAERTVAFHCTAPDDELLLHGWLNEVITTMACDHLLFTDFTVEIDDGRLSATGRGEPVDRARHEPAVEPKGATLTEIAVAATPDGWLAQCVVDV